MKRKSFVLALFAVLLGFTSLNSYAESKKNPIGKWKFSAPDAPYGYEAGIIEVKREDKKYTVSMAFTGLEYKFEGEFVQFVDDKLSFSIYIEGDDILIDLEFEEKNKLTGKASYSAGELPISAEREKGK